MENVWFISLRHRTHSDGEVKPIMSGVNKLLKQNMYFSHGYDLTSTMKDNLAKESKFLSESSQINYMWNYYLCKDFIEAGISTSWLIPMIQGYVGIVKEYLNSKPFQIALISRRSTKMAGTRFNSRGLDDEGNAANTVETEQIIIYENIIYSFNQIRGSVPIFWKQKSVFSKIKLTRAPELSFPAFSKHFDHLIKLYKRVIIINLLSEKKEGEVRLTRAYESNENEYEKKPSANIRYCHFDFHSERSVSVIAYYMRRKLMLLVPSLRSVAKYLISFSTSKTNYLEKNN